jgi:hypothetical protein
VSLASDQRANGEKTRSDRSANNVTSSEGERLEKSALCLRVGRGILSVDLDTEDPEHGEPSELNANCSSAGH